MIIVLMLSFLGDLKHLNVDRNSSISLSSGPKVSLRHVSKTSLSSAAMYSLNDARRKSGVILSSPNKHGATNRGENFRGKFFTVLLP